MEQEITINEVYNSQWNERKDKARILASIFFAFSAFLVFISYLTSISHLTAMTHFLYILEVLSLAFISVTLFAKLNKIITACALGVYGVYNIILFCNNTSNPISLFWLLIIGFLLFGLFAIDSLKIKNFNYIFAYIPVLVTFISLIIAATNFIPHLPKVFFDFALLDIIICFAFALFGTLLCNPVDNKFDKIFKNLGLAGIICIIAGIALAFIVVAISFLIYGTIFFFNGYAFTAVIWYLVIIALFFGLLLTPLTFCFNKQVKENSESEKSVYEDMYISLPKHILLLFFTFGVWQFIWTYRVTKYLNKTPNLEQHNPTSQLLLCLFVPFYSIFWIYTQAKKLDNLNMAINRNYTEKSTLLLILSIFVSIAAYILMQAYINEYMEAEVNPQQIAQAPSNLNQNIEDVKKLKELLDSGIITQEEFETKKKELLDL